MILDEFCFYLYRKPNYKEWKKILKVLYDNDFKYNFYKKGLFKASINNFSVEINIEESIKDTYTNLNKIDGISKIFSISDFIKINLEYKLKNSLSINIDSSIQKVFGYIEKKIEISGLSIILEQRKDFFILYIDLSEFGLVNQSDLKYCLNVLKEISLILNPPFGRLGSFVEEEYFREIKHKLNETTPFLYDIFYLNKYFVEKFKDHIFYSFNNSEFEILKNKGLFFTSLDIFDSKKL